MIDSIGASSAREVMAKLTRRRAIYAHARASDTREPANTPHRSSAGRLACARTQRRNLVSLSWIRFAPTLYNMAVSVCSQTFLPLRSRSRPTPKILVFGRFLHALPPNRFYCIYPAEAPYEATALKMHTRIASSIRKHPHYPEPFDIRVCGFLSRALGLASSF